METLFWVLFMLGSILAIWATLASLASLGAAALRVAVAREQVGELYELVDALAHEAGRDPEIPAIVQRLPLAFRASVKSSPTSIICPCAAPTGGHRA